MSNDRPDYEALYKIAYRKHHKLLGEIDELLMSFESGAEMTGLDIARVLRRIHDKHITHDWGQ